MQDVAARSTPITATGAGVPGKGPLLCLGYWDDPAANAELYTADGWMLTGDIVTIDDDGYLTVVGRTSDFIIRGGKNVSAAQVEDEVGEPPRRRSGRRGRGARRDVRRAGVRLRRAAPRSRRRSRLDELTAHLARPRGVARRLWPEQLVVVDDLPRASGGKIAKGELREDITRRLTA